MIQPSTTISATTPQAEIATAPIPEAEMQKIKARVFDRLAELPHAYHNLAHTKDRVLPCAIEYAREARLSPVDAQLLELAALYHDDQHAGATYRQLVRYVIGPRHSNEELAAIQAIDETKDLLSAAQSNILRDAILATSFGQNQIDKLPAEHVELLYRPYKPVTQIEKLLAFADVSNYRYGLVPFLQDNLSLIKESGADGIPETFADFIKTRFGLLGYVESKLNDVAEYFRLEFYNQLTGQLDCVRQELSGLNKTPEIYAGWETVFNKVRSERLQELAA